MLSGPYTLSVSNVVNNTTVSGGTMDHHVPIPATATTPGNPGDYAIDPVNGRRIDYTGDGTNHSWGSSELVAYPPSNP